MRKQPSERSLHMKTCFTVLLCLSMLLLINLFPLSASAVDFDTETLYQSVFTVKTNTALGSGFAIDNTHIITNAHVVQNEKTVLVLTYQEERLYAEVEKSDQQQDLAVLRLKDTTVPPLESASLNTVQNGDDIFTVGAPKSMAYTLTKGIVSNRERTMHGMTFIQIDAAVNEGNSGGPLLNAQGQVIGVNTLKIIDTEGIALAIPIDRVITFMQEETPAPSDESAPSDAPSENASDAHRTHIPLIAVLSAAVILLLFSNIGFIIYIVFQKNRTTIKPKQPEDRLDFEIELLE